MSDYIRKMTKDYNINLRYKLVPSEKVLDQLAVELGKVTKQYNNHLIDYDTFDNLKNLIVAKQNKTIIKWQNETGLCFYTGECLEQIKQDKQEQIAHYKKMALLEKERHKQANKKQPIDNNSNKILGLTVTEHCVLWCIVLLVLGS